jgi:hypothetical protein
MVRGFSAWNLVHVERLPDYRSRRQDFSFTHSRAQARTSLGLQKRPR